MLRERLLEEERSFILRGKMEGEEEGKREKLEEIVKNMIKMNIEDNVIIKVTGISQKEIDDIRFNK